MNAQTHEGPIRLLLVDDEICFVDVMLKRLAKRGIQATGACSATRALQEFRGADFDVAVLDLKMEDMDGIELLRVLRRMDPDLPVVMLTGHGSEEAAREGLALGAADYLAKPCDIAELTAKIRKLARTRRNGA